MNYSTTDDLPFSFEVLLVEYNGIPFKGSGKCKLIESVIGTSVV